MGTPWEKALSLISQCPGSYIAPEHPALRQCLLLRALRASTGEDGSLQFGKTLKREGGGTWLINSNGSFWSIWIVPCAPGVIHISIQSGPFPLLSEELTLLSYHLPGKTMLTLFRPPASPLSSGPIISPKSHKWWPIRDISFQKNYLSFLNFSFWNKISYYFPDWSPT